MTDTIAPVLTWDEWRRVAWTGEVEIAGVDLDRRRLDAAVMALANASLPADSLYKVTRADVALLASAAAAVDSLHWEVCSGACTCAAEEAALNRLAAKLAALLPPDSSLPGHT